MNKYKILLFFFLFLILVNKGNAQTIAYANLDFIVKNSNVGKKIILFFDEKNKKIFDEIKTKESEILKKEKKLISQKNILSDDDYSKKVNEIKKEIKVFNDDRSEKIKKFNLEKDHVSKLFMDEINIVLGDFAEKNKIDIILSSNQMLIGKTSLDLTKNILKEVNIKITKFTINNE